MNITLRKAHALQTVINEAVNKLAFSTDVALNEFEHPSLVIESANQKFFEAEIQRKELLDVLYSIRKQVALTNVAAGVNVILADIARVEKDITFYSMADRIEPRQANEVINGKVGKLKEQSADTGRSLYSSRDTVSTTIFAADTLTTFKQELSRAKKEKVRLQDMLLTANIKFEIELEPDEVSTLQAADLL